MIKLTGKIVWVSEREFTNDKNELVRGWYFSVLNEGTGDSRRYYVSNDNLKGFDPKLVSSVKGSTVEVSSDIKTYMGKDKIVLDKIIVIS